MNKSILPDSKRTLNPHLAPEGKLSRVNSLGRITEKNNGKFSLLMSKTNNADSITNCRKAQKSRVHSSFNINEMYEPNLNENKSQRK